MTPPCPEHFLRSSLKIQNVKALYILLLNVNVTWFSSNMCISFCDPPLETVPFFCDFLPLINDETYNKWPAPQSNTYSPVLHDNVRVCWHYVYLTLHNGVVPRQCPGRASHMETLGITQVGVVLCCLVQPTSRDTELVIVATGPGEWKSATLLQPYQPFWQIPAHAWWLQGGELSSLVK